MKHMKSKFHGQCLHCGGEISTGSPIVYFPGEGAVHDVCQSAFLKECQQKRLEEQREAERQANPPRTTDPHEIIKLLGRKPVWIKHGFCRACDSTIMNEWALSEHCCLHHAIFDSHGNGTLNRTEYNILQEALQAGLLNKEGVIGDVKHFTKRIFDFIRSK